MHIYIYIYIYMYTIQIHTTQTAQYGTINYIYIYRNK